MNHQVLEGVSTQLRAAVYFGGVYGVSRMDGWMALWCKAFFVLSLLWKYSLDLPHFLNHACLFSASYAT